MSKVWDTGWNVFATLLITKDLRSERRQDVGLWPHPLIWRIRSVVQARGLFWLKAVGLSPATGRSHRVGERELRRWCNEENALLSYATKLITNLSALFPVFILVSHFRASKSCSRGKCGKHFHSVILDRFFLSLLTVLTLLLLAGLRWSLRNLRLHRPVCARVGLQGPCSTECGNPWKEAFIQVLLVASSSFANVMDYKHWITQKPTLIN